MDLMCGSPWPIDRLASGQVQKPSTPYANRLVYYYDLLLSILMILQCRSINSDYTNVPWRSSLDQPSIDLIERNITTGSFLSFFALSLPNYTQEIVIISRRTATFGFFSPPPSSSSWVAQKNLQKKCAPFTCLQNKLTHLLGSLQWTTRSRSSIATIEI